MFWCCAGQPECYAEAVAAGSSAEELEACSLMQEASAFAPASSFECTLEKREDAFGLDLDFWADDVAQVVGLSSQDSGVREYNSSAPDALVVRVGDLVSRVNGSTTEDGMKRKMSKDRKV